MLDKRISHLLTGPSLYIRSSKTSKDSKLGFFLYLTGLSRQPRNEKAHEMEKSRNLKLELLPQFVEVSHAERIIEMIILNSFSEFPELPRINARRKYPREIIGEELCFRFRECWRGGAGSEKHVCSIIFKNHYQKPERHSKSDECHGKLNLELFQSSKA